MSAARFIPQESRGDSQEIFDSKIRDAVPALRLNSEALAWWTEKRGVSLLTLSQFSVGIMDRFGLRFTLPVFDVFGRLINVKYYNSKINPKQLQEPGRGKSPGWGKGTRVYGLHTEAAKAGPTKNGIGRYILFCAGEPDVLRAVSEGFTAVCGTNGEGALPREQDMDVLRGQLGWTTARIVYDADDAGQAGGQKLANAMLASGWKSVRNITLRCPTWLSEQAGEKPKWSCRCSDDSDCGKWGKDLTDWFNNGGDVELLRFLFGQSKDLPRLAEAAPPVEEKIWEPDLKPLTEYSSQELASFSLEDEEAPGPNRLINQILKLTRGELERTGSRNRSASYLGQQMVTEGYKEEDIERAAIAWSEEVSEVPDKPGELFSQQESITAAKSGARNPLPERNGTQYDWNDTGNAERFLEAYGENFRVLIGGSDREYWVWNGNYWEVNNSRVTTWARQTVAKMQDEARKVLLAGDDKKSAKLKSHATTSGNEGKLKAMLSLAGTYPDQQLYDIFDKSYAQRLAMPNGTLWLGPEGAEIIPSERHFGLREAVPTPWINDSARKAEKWNKLLEDAQPEAEIRDWLQKLFGLALYGANREQIVVFFLGESGAGKSTILTIVDKVLGPSSNYFNLSIFHGRTQEISAEKYSLINSRLIWNAETNSTVALHGDLLKTLTGGDSLSARRPFDRDMLRRIPAFLPILAGQVVPQINGADNALKRRLILVPFETSIYSHTEDKVNDLATVIVETEAEGVFDWIVQGWTKYAREGLYPLPQRMLAGAASIMADSSYFGSWFLDSIGFCEDDQLFGVDAYESYRNWCHSSNISEKEIMNNIHFGRAMSGIGHKSKVKREKGSRTTTRIYEGLNLK